MSAENELYDAIAATLSVETDAARELRDKARDALREAYRQGCADQKENDKRNIMALFK